MATGRCSSLAGILVGGAWSLHRQGASGGSDRRSSAVLALLATAGGVLWLVPGDG